MSRKQERYTSSRPRSLTTHYGSSSSVLGSMFSSQYSPYSNSYSNSYSPSTYRNYTPYTSGLGRSSGIGTSNLGIYGGTSSGYGGVYLPSVGSLNLMTPVLKKLDKKLLASQKNFKPKVVPVPKVVSETSPVEELPPVRPERKSRSAQRKNNLDKARSRSLTDLDTFGSLSSRSLSLNSLASDGYCSGSERTLDIEDDNVDYKALYEASSAELCHLRAKLATSEQELSEAKATIAKLDQMNQNASSESDKGEKITMQRKLSEMEEELKNQNASSESDKGEKITMQSKLSEMEEELKQLQKLKAENERLRAENRALTRFVSKLTNSAAK